MTALRHYLARYAALVLAGMNTKPPVGWTWTDGSNTDPTPMRRSGPTDSSGELSTLAPPARRWTGGAR